MKNFFKGLIFFFSLTIPLNAFNWIPLKTFTANNGQQKQLINKIINQETITYCVDEDDYVFKGVSFSAYRTSGSVMDENKVYDTSEAEVIFQDWFNNVLKRRKKYPNFDKEFADIIPILKAPKKMKKVLCGPASDKYSFDNLKTAQKGYNPSSEIEDLRIVFSSEEMLKEAAKIFSAREDSSGFYSVLSDRKLIWAVKSDSFVEKHILLHEFGHLLGFADVDYAEETQAKDYGSQTRNTIMSMAKSSLTCDDADGLVALLYLSLGKDKMFSSFCEENVYYDNGIKITFPDFKNLEQEIDFLDISTLTRF